MPNDKLFAVGQLYMTAGALARLDAGKRGQLFWPSGDTDGQGIRIFAAYRLKSGAQIWIINEAENPVTTYLGPNEF